MRIRMTARLRVWWVPNSGHSRFHTEVADIEQAVVLMDTLARYDQFLFHTGVRPNYSNDGGVEMLDPIQGWIRWSSPEGEIDPYAVIGD
jgi:hypothetical protein